MPVRDKPCEAVRGNRLSLNCVMSALRRIFSLADGPRFRKSFFVDFTFKDRLRSLATALEQSESRFRREMSGSASSVSPRTLAMVAEDVSTQVGVAARQS